MHLKITDAPYFVKIPARLKISVRSENPYLKISVQWCSGASCPELSGVLQRYSGRAGEDEGTHDQHTTTAGEPKQRNFFVLYIGIEKYLQKS